MSCNSREFTLPFWRKKSATVYCNTHTHRHTRTSTHTYTRRAWLRQKLIVFRKGRKLKTNANSGDKKKNPTLREVHEQNA